MIGVIANPEDHAVASEFFELFKTPWEFCQRGREYDVVLSAGDCEHSDCSAKLILVYAGRELPGETEHRIAVNSRPKVKRVLFYQGARIPIYGNSITFQGQKNSVLLDEDSREPALHEEQLKDGTLVRLGYDLFREVRWLLTHGQPSENASIPTLELHIAVLRDLILASGASLVEIPPAPEGYRFIACLTHDVDHPSIRLHKFDHTTFGFLYRAAVGSLIKFARGRQPFRSLLANWIAVLKLPLVHFGLAKDYWSGFDRYVQIEEGARSSFFLIPFKGDPGRKNAGAAAPHHRASPYAAADLARQIQNLTSKGCEIGLHGIDAWLDSSKGRKELYQIRQLTGAKDIGVRMHWLYFDEGSHATLEQAGADYDSTVGYNETVGYRAGTTQAYKPLGTARLLELPLHIMDTALFYPTHLDLSPREASQRVTSIVDNAVRFGGSVTVNWHDRSIAPERLWEDAYLHLLAELRSKGAWFATASEAVSWFRKRRSATFEDIDPDSGVPKLSARVGVERSPSVSLRIHRTQKQQPVGSRRR